MMGVARAGCCTSETRDRTSAVAPVRSCTMPVWLTAVDAAVFCGIAVEITRMPGVAEFLADNGGDAQDPDGSSGAGVAGV